MGKWDQFKKISIGILALLPLVIYQHCGSSSGEAPMSFSKNFPSISLAQGGNGDGYDGKPSDGAWVRTNPDFNCPTGLNSLQAIIQIDNRQPTILHDNCESKNFAFSLSDPSLKFEFYNSNFFTFGGAIFELVKPEAVPHINESLCRFKDTDQGIDIVVQSDNSKLSANVRKGVFSSRDISYVNYQFVSRTVSSNQTTIRSDDGSLQLVIQGAPQDYKDLTGVLTTHIDGALKHFPVICQKMSEKAVLFVDVTGLAAYWRFDQPTLADGGTVIDSKGYAPGSLFTGDANNKMVSGISGNALHLDGINDYVNMGANVFNMGTQNFSVSLWIKNVTSPIAIQILGDRTDLGGPQSGWSIMQTAGDSLDPRMSDNNPDTINSNQVALPTNPTSFQHFVAVYDRTNNLMRIYLNGALQRTVSTATVTGSVTYNGNFLIGAADFNKSFNFLGDLDEISIWNRVLTDSDVQAIYQNVVLY